MSLRNTLAIIVALVAITAGLVYVDYSSGRPGGSPSFFSSILKNVLGSTTITSELLTKAAFDPEKLVKQDSSDLFFAPYLKLPTSASAAVFTLDESIIISEVSADNAFEVVKALTEQTDTTGHYQLNIINAGTFYLNQTPATTKTHNYLGIVINNVLYGFQYPASRHPDILRLIDALQNNQ
jgi:hypothetical protein